MYAYHSKIKQAAGWPSGGQWPPYGHFAFAIGGPLPLCHLPMALVQWPSNGLADKRPVQAHFLLPLISLAVFHKGHCAAFGKWPCCQQASNANGLADKRPVQAHFLLAFRWQFSTKGTALPLANGHAGSRQIVPCMLPASNYLKRAFKWTCMCTPITWHS